MGVGCVVDGVAAVGPFGLEVRVERVARGDRVFRRGGGWEYATLISIWVGSGPPWIMAARIGSSGGGALAGVVAATAPFLGCALGLSA